MKLSDMSKIKIIRKGISVNKVDHTPPKNICPHCNSYNVEYRNYEDGDRYVCKRCNCLWVITCPKCKAAAVETREGFRCTKCEWWCIHE